MLFFVILCYSFLFFSLLLSYFLFYSILFYSILFCSITLNLLQYAISFTSSLHLTNINSLAITVWIPENLELVFQSGSAVVIAGHIITQSGAREPDSAERSQWPLGVGGGSLTLTWRSMASRRWRTLHDSDHGRRSRGVEDHARSACSADERGWSVRQYSSS
jgi:hypothetical protein